MRLSPSRTKSAALAALAHLVICLAVALFAAIVVFKVWYPTPFDKLTGGRELFMLIVTVDVVCGPILTLVLFNPQKLARELWFDLSLVALVQMAALSYGLTSTYLARPVFIAFENDRFRVVTYPEIEIENLPKAPKEFQQLWLGKPRLVGVRLLTSKDPAFLKSLEDAINGLHPSFRPARWVPYETQRDKLLTSLKPMSLLKQKNSAKQSFIDEWVRNSSQEEQDLGYLPLIAKQHTDWVVIISRKTTLPIGYLPIDGW